jgi:hypothetical protein
MRTFMHTEAVRSLVRVLFVVAALVLAGAASADGDPASDVLISQETFVPYPSPAATAVKALVGAVHLVDVKGDRVKVAVIAKQSDLGSVPSLYGHAQNYAKFLSVELSFIYKGPLLIVMPSGFGFSRAGHAVPAADAALVHIADNKATADGLTLAAARAVPALENAGVLHYKDTLAPQTYSAPSKVFAGRRVALRYQVWDDSGRAKVEITIKNTHHVTLARFGVPLRTITQGAWYWVVWRAPLSFAHHVLSVCSQATDAAGNRSPVSCARLAVT